MSTTALVIGATGLVGRELTRLLLADEEFSTVKAFLRTPSGLAHTKLQEIQTDFEHLENVRHEIHGEVLYSCLGTTLKTAGSKEAQYRVDYTFQYEFARIASENKVPDYLLISSPGADPRSRFFYSRIKGELEREVKKLPFRRHIFVQPSILRGKRDKKRFGEQLAGDVIDGLARFIPPLRKYHSITGEEVARAMIRLYKDPAANGIYGLDALHT